MIMNSKVAWYIMNKGNTNHINNAECNSEIWRLFVYMSTCLASCCLNIPINSRIDGLETFRMFVIYNRTYSSYIWFILSMSAMEGGVSGEIFRVIVREQPWHNGGVQDCSSTDREMHMVMVRTKSHLIGRGCPLPSIAVQCRFVAKTLFIDSFKLPALIYMIVHYL